MTAPDDVLRTNQENPLMSAVTRTRYWTPGEMEVRPLETLKTSLIRNFYWPTLYIGLSLAVAT
jgi:hypothetical protein